MKRRRLLLNLLLVGGLWFANDALARANMDPESCWRICYEYISCDTPCIVGSEEWVTCGQSGWPCDPGE